MVDEKLAREAAKFIEKKIRLSLELERIQRNYVKGLSKFLGIPASELEKSIAVQHYYEAIKKGKPEIAKKIVEELLKRWKGTE